MSTSELWDPGAFWPEWPHPWLSCPVSLWCLGNVVENAKMGKVFYSHIYQDIPHLEARVDIDNSYKESSLNLHPSQDLMNQAYKVQEWKRLGLGYPCDLSIFWKFVKYVQILGETWILILKSVWKMGFNQKQLFAFKSFSFLLSPNDFPIDKIFQDMMLFLNWTRAAILYEDEYGLIRLQELVRLVCRF